MMFRRRTSFLLTPIGAIRLSACATPARMHDEASPGPMGSFHLFEKFMGMMR
jgi:carbamoylphosphate synthase small subunit